MARKRKNSPYYQYDFTLQGRRYRGSLKTNSKGEASLVEAGLRSKILLGDKDITLDKACGLYWEEHGRRLKSAPTLRYQLLEIGKSHFAHKNICDIGVADVSDYKKQRSASISESSVNRELTLLRAVINKAVNEWGYNAPRLPWKKLFFHEPEPSDFYLKRQDAETLMEHAHPSLREMIVFSLMTGVRYANCFNLKWEQIDFDAAQITFRVKSRSPNGKTHVIPIVRELLLFLGNLPRRGAYVFDRLNFQKRWLLCRKQSGIKMRWHDLRHTCASWLLQNGTPLDVVKDILGHANIQTTMRYAHRNPAEKKEALEKIQSHLGHIRFLKHG